MSPAPGNSPATARLPNTPPRSGMRSPAQCHREGSTHDDFTARRQAGAQRRCWSIWPASNANISSASPISTIPSSWSASAPAGIAARRFAARLPRPISSRSRKPSAITGAPTAPTARSTWARTRTRFPGRLSARRSKCWRRTACRRSSSEDDGVTPTPVISHAILVHNRSRTEHLADGIVITPSHNPPEDGGFKYNPTNGGPADTDVTQWVENRANELLRNGNAE